MAFCLYHSIPQASITQCQEGISQREILFLTKKGRRCFWRTAWRSHFSFTPTKMVYRKGYKGQLGARKKISSSHTKGVITIHSDFQQKAIHRSFQHRRRNQWTAFLLWASCRFHQFSPQRCLDSMMPINWLLLCSFPLSRPLQLLEWWTPA